MFENSLIKFRFANYLLAVFILFAVLLLIRNMVSTTFSKKAAPHVVSSGKTSASLEKKDIMQHAAILEKNLFGRPMQLHPIMVQQKTEQPSGSLTNLVLVGTAVGPDKLSYALFKDKSQSNEQAVVGYREKVFNYGIVTKITMSYVEIEQNGERYTLTFPTEKDVAGNKTHRTERQPARQSSFARKVGDREYVLDSQSVQKSLENPEKILTDARLLPNFVNGKQEGFKISEVVPDGLYSSLGLSNGDILLRVNGLEISNPEVAMQAMTALRGMNKVNLDIIRDGTNMSMSYQMR